MSARFTYSRWDGTQTGYSVNADEILDELTDDLLMHGDLQAALRRLMREGMTDKDGNRIEGLREMMDRIRQRKKELEESGDLGGVYSEIADALKDIVDEERHAVENAVRDAEASGDERRAETARDAAMERNFRLDMMPEDLAGLVRELQSYDFESQEAKERFEEMLDKLRQQMMQQVVDQMSEGMQNMTPEDMARMKDMMAALNQMIEKREQGEDPEFEKFMEEFGDFFPENPQTLDELLENMAQRMQAMQDFMNSLTPEQRSQMQQLSDQLMEDMDLSWQMQQLGEKLSQMFPQPGNGQGYNFRGEQPMDMQQAMQAMAEMGQLNDMEAMMRQAASPAQLSEVDIDKVRDLLGDSAAKSLQKLAEMTKVLEEAGLINNKEGRLEVTPRGLRAIGNNALREMFNKLSKDKLGQHRIPREGSGHERTYDSKPYEFGDPFRLDLQRTIRNAISRQGSGTPVRLSPEDFEIERTEHTTQASTVLLLDLSFSMVQADRFVPAKKVAIAMHSLISSQFPRDFLSIIGFSSIAYPLRPDQLPEVSWDREYGTNMHHAFALARKQLAGKAGTKQIIMITDGEPTSHITPEGYPVFTYPYIQESVELAMREVMRLTKEGITLNSFVLDASGSLRQIIEQMAEINKGRAFFTSADTLGDYVLVDFLENRRRTARSR
ncbi:unannotated protein [freshwater metagenome]|uniref:Unannotated protein n=1 Tax=freshwater metagenome TaxID=449393 RepID=A0A6J6LU49_9ZZZZ|nr:hypothetical protein [Actinomycetota bacterium]MSZ32064.1 hypothetical protein [Actinomycetota bacterium]